MSEWRKKLDGYFIAFARRAFGWSHFKKDALKLAEVRKGVWRCLACGEETKKPKVDHVEPVVPVTSPWDRDWNEYRDRLFTDHLQVLCPECNQIKNNAENLIRRQYRGFNKGKKSETA